jgi:hypothetical protein
MYFVIQGSEDGTQIATCSDEAALKRHIEDSGLKKFREQMTSGDHFQTDPNYWPHDTCLIIKGSVLIPKPKEVVKDWEF